MSRVFPRRRLLIVEDEPLLGQLFRDLAGEFCAARLATSAQQALTLLEASPSDVVLADANLGAGRSGIWLLEQVAERWPHMRRCLMSGGEHSPRDDEYIFFFKPLSLEDLQTVACGELPADVRRRARTC